MKLDLSRVGVEYAGTTEQASAAYLGDQNTVEGVGFGDQNTQGAQQSGFAGVMMPTALF